MKQRFYVVKPNRAAFALIAAASLMSITLLGGGHTPAHADATADALNSTVTAVAPSIVSLRVIDTVTRKANGQSANQDVTVEFKGVVVSADGLVMCTNSYISGDPIRGALGVPADDTDADISVVPQEIRITVGDETTEYYGTVAATEATLGLAFIQIRDLNGRQLPFVDMTAESTATPGIGDVTASVTRLDKTHDYAPFAVVARIVGTIAKPRRAFMTDSDPAALGLPVYADGALLGVESYFPLGERTPDDRYTEGISRLFDDYVNVQQSEFIVPAANVAPLIDLAKKQAAALPPFTVPKPRPAVATPAGPPKPTAGAGSAPAMPTMPTTPASK